MRPTLRYLSQQDVLQLGGADPHRALQDVIDVVHLMRGGEAHMPAETHIDLATPLGKAYALPAYVGGRFNAAGVKWTAHRPQAGDALPQALALTLINRADSGVPVGLVESALLTATRTAAVSAIALRYAAPRPVKRVLLLGAGVQAQAHIAMLKSLFPDLEQLICWNRTEQKRARLLANAGDLPWPVACPATLAAALAGEADALITCTSATQPFLGASVLREGTIVLQIGYHEMRFSGIRRATKVVADLWGDFSRTSAKSLFQMYRAGRFSPDELAADLGHLLLDHWRPAADDRVYFSSFGLNVFDIALAARLLQDAERQQRGRLLPLFPGVQ
ncbi:MULTISPECIES: ornithine cyclodeaminase family protein [Brenneria]|uniref:Ornithine cyclodeaminase n=1 Tax=Brenneria nigrifluens DSM 30175 = ATCC 13028 TaxID=1121120 RepID=A0A2U1UPK3_9GAMM|nr:MULTISPECIES: ornithine cyclodeaminase family protein [Brenneria]EHD21461.1 ornithine cyclodeaminase/mu-crystallin [Brenneria sp. EniD312]PWC23603.1 ornithine cyclodeaminase [Brenneria nigrifluens] [Brenneria nigrifluens DSM 30175 = ATCC 13028]QCR04586.1 ornithine cyclodeaminase [Brenneria nigrifluens] [Brenneria nigrifluens DSM 30175 = ATCC 13028]